MCYFVEHNIQRKELEKRFKVKFPEDQRYMPTFFSSAFTKPFLPVITSEHSDVAQLFQWGLIPHWAPDSDAAEKLRNTAFNARAETVWEKPVFRKAVQSGRCLVSAHGFFEYHTESNKKTPYYIKLKNGDIFAFAGIYDQWVNPATAEIITSFSIITTIANPLMEEVHNVKKRMPVILSVENERNWINPDLSVDSLNAILTPFPHELMEAYPVSSKISGKNPDISDPSLIEKVEITKDLRLF